MASEAEHKAPHHRHHRHKHRHHHHHSGNGPWFESEELPFVEVPYASKPYPVNADHRSFDQRQYTTTNHITNPPPGNPLKVCLQALRGLGRSELEQMLATIIADLNHTGHLGGLVRVYDLAKVQINHYTAVIEARDY